MSILRRGRSLIIDLFIVASASGAALALRENFAVGAERLEAFAPYLLCTLVLAGPVLVMLELDRSIWRFSGLADYVRATHASMLIVAGAAVAGFITNRLDGVARSLPLLQFVLMVAGLVGGRVLSRVIHDRRRPGERSQIALPGLDNTILLIGYGPLAELFVRSVIEFGAGRVSVAGILSPRDRHIGRLMRSIRVLGKPEDVGEVIADLDVHGIHVGRIVIAVPFERLSSDARRILREIERTKDVRLEFVAERLGFGGEGRWSSQLGSGGVMCGPGIHTSALAIDDNEIAQVVGRSYWRAKRMIDATVALAMIVVLSPLILLTALFVALDVGLPVLFVQQRPGLRGYPFKLYKFRTMGASHDREGLRILDEMRLSRIGSFLRRTRLDELPQLFNILRGDMSFVGPRPLVSREQSQDVLARLLVRPGLTGWAQVHGGRAVSVADKAALDLWYLRNASLGLDLRIIFSTLPIILFGERVDGEVVRLAWRELHGLEGRGQLGE